MTRAERILVVDDDPGIAELLDTALRFAGFEVTTAVDVASALTAIAADPPDAVVLDVMMPGAPGLDLVRLLRAQQNLVPVLLLTARQTVQEKVYGLRSGADDYVTKPFDLVEVVARVEALLRRARYGGPADDETLRCADLSLDESAHTVTRSGVSIALSPTEFRLLRYLLLNTGRVVSKAQILQQVWQYDFGGDAAVVERFVSNLRRKIDDGRHPLIHTVRGFGYTVRSDPP